jgi:putative two-component system response regulator
MVSDRPYAASMSVAEARAELRRCAGSQFDATVVEALCDVLANGQGGQHVPRAVDVLRAGLG